jgi:hypothetical protein
MNTDTRPAPWTDARFLENQRKYFNAFVSKWSDADGECAETQVWIDYGRDCGYWSSELAAQLTAGYEEVGRMLGGIIAHPEKFCGSAGCPSGDHRRGRLASMIATSPLPIQ